MQIVGGNTSPERQIRPSPFRCLMSGRFTPIRPASLLLALLLGCGGDPTGPSSGSLAVQVIGLPAGTSADLVVTGPGGFNRPLGASQTLTALTPGTYTITA